MISEFWGLTFGLFHIRSSFPQQKSPFWPSLSLALHLISLVPEMFTDLVTCKICIKRWTLNSGVLFSGLTAISTVCYITTPKYFLFSFQCKHKQHVWYATVFFNKLHFLIKMDLSKISQLLDCLVKGLPLEVKRGRLEKNVLNLFCSNYYQLYHKESTW